MRGTFFFYDLETSGFNPREARIMQFAGQRTSLDLEPMGEPHNYLIKMTSDILPDADAVLITGITPQQTIAEGLTEAEFLKIFTNAIATPGTIFVGFNTIRFDDEFMRFLHFRNFYDPYEWHWADERSRWDLLDVVRMTRALRPEGIEWPFDSSGAPANRLQLLTAVNKLDHQNAHDALSDVQATIAVARLLRLKQPKLFTYLLNHRDKKSVAELVWAGQPFVYSSGKYPSEFEKTTAVCTLAELPDKGGALVYDLRHDPKVFMKLSPTELLNLWQHRCDERPCPHERLPVKTMKFNRCPAIAPLSVLDKVSQERLKLNLDTIRQHAQVLQQADTFKANVLEALAELDKKQQMSLVIDEALVDSRLYDSFVPDADKSTMRAVRAADAQNMAELTPSFKDDRLSALFPLYKARNFPKTLSDEERATWERFRERKLLGGKNDSRAAHYFERLATLAAQPNLPDSQRYLLEELQLYGQSVLPGE